MNLHEPTEVETDCGQGGELDTEHSICANCNQAIERPEYYDDDRGYFYAKHWSVVTYVDGATAGVRVARFDKECLPVLT